MTAIFSLGCPTDDRTPSRPRPLGTVGRMGRPFSNFSWPWGKRARDEFAGLAEALVALVALIVGRNFDSLTGPFPRSRTLVWLAAVVLVIFGVMAARRFATALGRVVARRSMPSAAGVVQILATSAGFLVVLFAVLALLGVSLGQLLIGAGIAGVVLGIAAQQSLGNIFAALMLLLARPYRLGDHIRIRSGSVGVLDVWVLDIGLTYVTVQTEDGTLKIPNSAMLAAGIGQLAPAPPPVPPPATPPPTPDVPL